MNKDIPVITTPYDWFHTVEESDLDQNKHVNNVVYVKWMENVAIQNSSSWGLTPEFYLQLGATWVARRHTIEYLHQAFLGDELVIRTWISEIKRVSSVRSYEIVRPADGLTIATGETLWAFVNIKDGRPTRILPEVMEAIERAKVKEG